MLELDEILKIVDPNLEMVSMSLADIESYLGTMVNTSIRLSEHLHAFVRERDVSRGLLNENLQMTWDWGNPVSLRIKDGLRIAWQDGMLDYIEYVEPVPWSTVPIVMFVHRIRSDASLIIIKFLSSGSREFHNDRFPAILHIRDGKIVDYAYSLEGVPVSFWSFYDKATEEDKRMLLRDWLPLEDKT